MNITRITVYSASFTYSILSRARASRREIDLDDTVVAIETDTGVVGYGEACPLAPTYLPMLADATRAGIAAMAPHLLGRDPRGIGAIDDAMDAALLGFPDAKAAIDMACWDLLAKATALPVHTLLGGRQAERALLYVSIAHDSPEAMAESVRERRAHGYRRFQIKVGGEAEADIERLHQVAAALEPGERAFADANRGWLLDDALRVTAAVDGLDLIIEQPCATYEECLEVRRKTRRPIMLDEIIGGPTDLMRAIADRALDAVVLKLTHVGGLSRALEMVRMCCRTGIRVRIEDTVGCELSNAAVSHLCMAVPPRFLLAGYICPSYGLSLGSANARVAGGHVSVSDDAGLGVGVDERALGEPVHEWRR